MLQHALLSFNSTSSPPPASPDLMNGSETGPETPQPLQTTTFYSMSRRISYLIQAIVAAPDVTTVLTSALILARMAQSTIRYSLKFFWEWSYLLPRCFLSDLSPLSKDAAEAPDTGSVVTPSLTLGSMPFTCLWRHSLRLWSVQMCKISGAYEKLLGAYVVADNFSHCSNARPAHDTETGHDDTPIDEEGLWESEDAGESWYDEVEIPPAVSSDEEPDSPPPSPMDHMPDPPFRLPPRGLDQTASYRPGNIPIEDAVKNHSHGARITCLVKMITRKYHGDEDEEYDDGVMYLRGKAWRKGFRVKRKRGRDQEVWHAGREMRGEGT